MSVFGIVVTPANAPPPAGRVLSSSVFPRAQATVVVPAGPTAMAGNCELPPADDRSLGPDAGAMGKSVPAVVVENWTMKSPEPAGGALLRDHAAVAVPASSIATTASPRPWLLLALVFT